MLRDALFIARSDLADALRQKETLVWTFAMPLVFFWFIGKVTAGFAGSDDERTPIAVVAGEDGGFLLDELDRRLEERGFEVRRAGEGTARKLAVPAHFTADVLAAKPVRLSYSGGSDGLDGDYDAFKVRRAGYTVLADLVAVSQTAETPSAADFDALAKRPRALTVAATTAGRRVKPPAGFEQTVPGTMTMFTLIVLLTSGAVRLAIERKEGLLRRLASTPISRGSIVLGKWASRLGLGLVQVAVGLVAGTFLFGVHWGPDLPMVLVVLVAWASLAASLSLLLASLARTDAQAIAIGVLSTNVLAALGGCWWPIEITPRFLQGVARFLPTGWTMHALHELVNFQTGWRSAVPDALLLSLAAAAVGWTATRLFRFE
jgi:ABC-type multidrug transport system permease subunit